MRRAQLGWCSIISLLACQEATSFDDLVPDHLDWLAGVAVRPSSGAVSSATRLAPSDQSLALVRRTDERLWLIGFEDASIAPIRTLAALEGSSFEGLIASSALAEPTLCAQRLPRPDWSASIDPDGRAEERPTEEVPRFRAPWLATSCGQLPLRPGLGTEVLSPFSVELEHSYCDRSALVQTGCGLRLDWTVCNVDVTTPAELTLEWDGRICASTQKPCVLREADSRPPELTIFDCELGGARSSELRLHLTPWAPADAFVGLEFARVIPEEIIREAPRSSVDPNTLHSNYVSSIVDLGREVVVSTHPERRAERTCKGEAPTRLVFLDVESLSVTRTATAPDCLTRLAAHPEGGFVGAYDPGTSAFAIARFDDSGRLLGRHPLRAQSNVRDYWLPSLDYLPSIDRFLVVFSPANRGLRDIPASESEVFLLDRALEIVARRPFPEVPQLVSVGAVHPVDTVDGPRLVIAEDADGRYLQTDLELTRIENVSPLFRAGGGSRRTLALLQLTDRRIIVSAGGDLPMLGRPFLGQYQSVGEEAYPFEALAEASILAPLPGGLVLGVMSPQNAATNAVYLSRFDLKSWRFMPGSPRLRLPDGTDPGPATRKLVDEKGRIWLGFSNSPFVARLTPARSE